MDARTKLEHAFAERYRVPYVLATASGTSAYLAALLAVKAHHHGQVVLSAYNWPQLAAVPRTLGYRVKLVDCDTEGRPSEHEIERALDAPTAAVVVSHLFGNPANCRRIAASAAQRGVPLIEDCSQALLASQGGRRVGTWGCIGFASLGRGKLLSAVEGGLLWTHSRELSRAAFALTQHPDRTTDPRLGERCLLDSMSLRMHPAGAERALRDMVDLDERATRLSANLDLLRSELARVAAVRVVDVYEDAAPSWQHFPLVVGGDVRPGLGRLVSDQLPAHRLADSSRFPNAVRFDSQVRFLKVTRKWAYVRTSYLRRVARAIETAFAAA
jgi:dTDP-4-amino-4,6-dideoxygalactose transaminase